jgi:hypothetical protein
MTRGEYEERRRALEAQRQADIALINAAHETRIRSLDRLWQAAAEDDAARRKMLARHLFWDRAQPKITAAAYARPSPI